MGRVKSWIKFRTRKNFSLTQEKLEERLLDLDKTKDDFEAISVFAMCYAPTARMWMPDVTQKATCNGCGKKLEITSSPGPGYDGNVLSAYSGLAREYQELGYDARINCYCDKCVRKMGLPSLDCGQTNVFFAFRPKDVEEYHLTPLTTNSYYSDELKMVLEFLKGASSYKDLDKECNRRHSSLFNTADGFRNCIERVLGVEIPQ